MIFKKIVENLSSILVARILFQVFNALTQIIIARFLGVELFGVFSTALALVNTFIVANDIGMVILMIKEGSRVREKIKYYLGNTLAVQLVASFIFYSLALIVGFSLGYEFRIMILVIILGVAYMFFEFRKPLRAVLRILLKMKKVALLEIIVSALIFISIYILSKTTVNKEIALYVIVFFQLIGYLILSSGIYLYLRKFVKPDFSALKETRGQLKISWQYSMYNVLYVVYLQVSILMVSSMAGTTEAGLYSAASKLIVLLFVIPQMIFNIALPLMFKYSKENIEKYKRIHGFIHKYLVAFGFPIATGMFLLSEEIINLVYDKAEFMPAALALQIFSVFIIFRFFGNVCGQSLTANDKQKQKLIVSGICFLILIIGNILLIPKYGFIGAVIMTAIAETLLRIFYIFFDLKYLKTSLFPYLKKAIPIVISCTLMGGFVYFTKDFVNVIIVIVSSGLLYGLLLWVFRFFDGYDKKLYNQLFNKNDSINPHTKV
ncbi:MAG: flippase [Patescibacteria group bacterium]